MAALLLDQNLSPRLVRPLSLRFPGTLHVRDCALERADDAAVFAFAREHDLVLLSKDGDFHHLGLLHGAPPKVIWVRAGNCSTDRILQILDRDADRIAAFLTSPDEAVLVLERL